MYAELARQEATQRIEEWKKDREQRKEAIEARRKQLYRHFYGSNTSYMTFCIPHDSKLRKTSKLPDDNL